jgi:hypothetical protein
MLDAPVKPGMTAEGMCPPPRPVATARKIDSLPNRYKI